MSEPSLPEASSPGDSEPVAGAHATLAVPIQPVTLHAPCPRCALDLAITIVFVPPQQQPKQPVIERVPGAALKMLNRLPLQNGKEGG